MKKPLILSLGIVAVFTLPAKAVLVWTVGMNDAAWPTNLTGGGPNTNFWQEGPTTNALPGSPNSPQVNGQSDSDYYFAGTYSATVASNGAYTPVGIVAANEGGAERAFAGINLTLRYHSNLPSTFTPTTQLSVSFDALNLDNRAVEAPNSRFGVEVYFNNVLVGPQVIVLPADVAGAGTTFTTAPFTLASVGAVAGPGTDNIVTLKGISYSADGGGNWMGVDYVQLDTVVIPEPSSSAMVFLTAMASLGFLGRRRSRI